MVDAAKGSGVELRGMRHWRNRHAGGMFHPLHIRFRQIDEERHPAGVGVGEQGDVSKGNGSGGGT